MYVCLCNGITDKQILQAAREGATTLEALQARTGCATQCGSCGDHALSLAQSIQPNSTGAAVSLQGLNLRHV